MELEALEVAMSEFPLIVPQHESLEEHDGKENSPSESIFYVVCQALVIEHTWLLFNAGKAATRNSHKTKSCLQQKSISYLGLVGFVCFSLRPAHCCSKSPPKSKKFLEGTTSE